MEVSSSSTAIEPTINVRSLISVYENKATNIKINIRPRARSVENILSKNVIVKVSQFKTLDDVEKVLDTIEQRLDQYEIYNKEKHVALQEELFNILTVIINIDNDDPGQAKALISKTKDYVSVLNTKLPCNNIIHRYETYSDRSIKLTTKKSQTIENYADKTFNSVKIKSNDELDSIKPISVKILKEKFQPSHQHQWNEKIKIAAVKQPSQVSLSNNYINSKNVKNPDFSVEKPQNKLDELPVKKFPATVWHLRNIFETKSKENATGLPLILKEQKPPITRFNYKSNMPEAKSLENLKYIHISSYLKPAIGETNGLLNILKNEKEFHYNLAINDEDRDTGEISQPKMTTSYLKNNNFDPMASLEYIENAENNNDEEDSTSTVSSDDSVNTADSIKTAVMRVENGYVDSTNSLSENKVDNDLSDSTNEF